MEHHIQISRLEIGGVMILRISIPELPRAYTAYIWEQE